jgi:hypothetical protein
MSTPAVLTASSSTEELAEGADAAIRAAEEKESKDEEEVSPPAPITDEERQKYANWPLKDIKEPHPNDVLYGRGGSSFVKDVVVPNEEASIETIPCIGKMRFVFL